MKKLLFVALFAVIGTGAYANDLGKATYEIACKNCHAPNLAKAIKAPAAFDKKAWQLRFDEAAAEAKKNPEQYKTAMDYLLYRVHIGKGLMVHGGLCNEAPVSNKDCSEDAFRAAITYMSQ